MKASLADYAAVAGADVIDQLRQLAESLRGMRIVHVNSTRLGGGVAEILTRLVPLMEELGLKASWEQITGGDEFYQCTKSFHNALQGQAVALPERSLRAYERANAEAAERMAAQLAEAEVVIIHDPQPALLLRHLPHRKGKWIWRCHIDISRPRRAVWKYLRPIVAEYDGSIFSLSSFAQHLPHPMYLVPPSIDPLSDKNVELSRDEVTGVLQSFRIDPERPLMAQISRFDRFKDPLGVIEAYRLAKAFVPGIQLVLAGGSATDDPEGSIVLSEVRGAAGDDPDIHVLELPPDAHRIINALQRSADVVLQKSLREGFGLTVTEGMWKGKPVIGGDTGGIRLQIVNHHTGFLVSTPEGAALRIRYLLSHRTELAGMGRKAREFVRENFLLTRHLREYLALMVSLMSGDGERIVLGE